MSRFKEEEWQKYLDNMVPGYSRKVSNSKINNIQYKNIDNGKTIRDVLMREGIGYTRKAPKNNEIVDTQKMEEKHKTLNKMTKDEMRDFFHNTKEGKQMIEDIKEILFNNK